MTYQRVPQISIVVALNSGPTFAQISSPEGDAGQDRQAMRQDRQHPCVSSI